MVSIARVLSSAAYARAVGLYKDARYAEVYEISHLAGTLSSDALERFAVKAESGGSGKGKEAERGEESEEAQLKRYLDEIDEGVAMRWALVMYVYHKMNGLGLGADDKVSGARDGADKGKATPVKADRLSSRSRHLANVWPTDRATRSGRSSPSLKARPWLRRSHGTRFSKTTCSSSRRACCR